MNSASGNFHRSCRSLASAPNLLGFIPSSRAIWTCAWLNLKRRLASNQGCSFEGMRLILIAPCHRRRRSPEQRGQERSGLNALFRCEASGAGQIDSRGSGCQTHSAPGIPAPPASLPRPCVHLVGDWLRDALDPKLRVSSGEKGPANADASTTPDLKIREPCDAGGYLVAREEDRASVDRALSDVAVGSRDRDPLASSSRRSRPSLPSAGPQAPRLTPSPARSLEACLRHLRARTAEAPTPPADAKRSTEGLTCACRDCTALSTFVADPRARTWTLKAIAVKRAHIESVIRAARTDLDLVTVKKGSPHSLVCTKNQSTYQGRARQHRADLDTIARLERARAG